jgi:hypothetical protein
MIDNFDKIRNMLKFTSGDTFYFLQVLKRRKDNPDLGKDMVHIADYYIDSLEKFDFIQPIVINQCNAENARAYFRLNIRDAKKVANEVLKRLVEYTISENYKPAKNLYASCTGEFHSDPDKTWIVDIDWKDIPASYDNDEYVDFIETIVNGLIIEGGRESNTTRILTKNGIHLIVRPFNLKKFQQILLMDNIPMMDIHRDNPTLLYCK